MREASASASSSTKLRAAAVLQGRGESGLASMGRRASALPGRKESVVLVLIRRSGSNGSADVQCPRQHGAALADLPPVVDMPRFPGANEPCRKHAFAITSRYHC